MWIFNFQPIPSIKRKLKLWAHVGTWLSHNSTGWTISSVLLTIFQCALLDLVHSQTTFCAWVIYTIPNYNFALLVQPAFSLRQLATLSALHFPKCFATRHYTFIRLFKNLDKFFQSVLKKTLLKQVLWDNTLVSPKDILDIFCPMMLAASSLLCFWILLFIIWEVRDETKTQSINM